MKLVIILNLSFFTMLLFFTQVNAEESKINALPKSIVFAVQPHDADKFNANDLNNNIVVRLSRQLGVEIKLFVCPWARCMKAIENGSADIIDDLFYSVEREMFTYFLNPNFDSQTEGFRFYADNSVTPSINKWDDLYGLRIGMLRGYAHFPKFENDEKLIKLDFLDVEKMASMIVKQRIDAFISPPSFDEKSFAKIQSAKRITQQPFDHIETIPLYVGLSKQSVWYKHKAYMEEQLQELLVE